MEEAIVISASVRSRHYGKLSGGLAQLPGVARAGALEAIPMPRVAVRPLRSSLCRFPHASPVSPSRAGKQKTAPKDRSKQLISLRELGAGEGIRTLDPNLGKVVLALGSAMRRNPAAKVASGALGDRGLSHLCEPPRQKTPFEKPFESACLNR